MGGTRGVGCLENRFECMDGGGLMYGDESVQLLHVGSHYAVSDTWQCTFSELQTAVMLAKRSALAEAAVLLMIQARSRCRIALYQDHCSFWLLKLLLLQTKASMYRETSGLGT